MSTERLYDVPLTAEEALWLVNMLPPQPRFMMPDDTVAGGIPFRLKVLALYRYIQQHWDIRTPLTATLPLELTVGELWLLDTVINNIDLTRQVMGGGTRLQVLAEKIWDALLDAYASELDPRYLPKGLVTKPVAPEEAARQREFLNSIDTAGMFGAGPK